MRVSMWSSWFIDLTPEQMVETFVGAGWDCTELSSEHGRALLDRGDATKVGTEFRNFAAERGLSFPQGHFNLHVDLVQPDPEARTAMVEDMRRWCDLFMALGIEAGVLHRGGVLARQAGWDAKRIFAANVETLRELLSFLKGGPTSICLENGGGGLAALARLIDTLGKDGMGICLDTGHLNLGKQNCADFVIQAGARLKALHIADNRGEHDDHLLPYASKTTVDWAGFAEALEQIGYDGLFNYEVPGESRHAPGGAKQLLPLPVRLAKLEYARRLAEAMLA